MSTYGVGNPGRWFELPEWLNCVNAVTNVSSDCVTEWACVEFDVLVSLATANVVNLTLSS